MNRNHYLTLGTIWHMEWDYARDFVEFHREVGVEKFVIFDTEFYRTQEIFKNDPDVEVIHFPPASEVPGNVHQEAWGQLIKFNQGKTKWLALIDGDMALVPVKCDDVKEILKDYEDFASLQINWKTFGSGHQETKTPGSLYERFTMCAGKDVIFDFHTQFICQPDRTLPIRTQEPHYPILSLLEKMVNTNKEEISPFKTVSLNPNTPLSFNVPALHDVLFVNHYNNKSKEEWIFKNNRGRADIPGQKMPFSQFDEYDLVCNQERNTRAAEIWEKVKKRLESIK